MNKTKEVKAGHKKFISIKTKLLGIIHKTPPGFL